MTLITELANTINLMAPISGFAANEFNPLPLIKAVNYFHGLGYNKSLKLLELYGYSITQIKKILPDVLNDIDIDKEEFSLRPGKILTVTCLLFIPKNKQIILPTLPIGYPDVEPLEPSLFPWFPLHLYEDIPFCLPMLSFILMGDIITPNDYLKLCRKKWKIRETPLRPNNNPLESVDNFFKSEVWKTLKCRRMTK